MDITTLGFLAFALPDVEMLMPTRKPRGQELALEEQLANQALHHRRLRIEHVNSSVKLSHCARPAALVEEGHPRFDDGTVLCPAQLPGASGPLAAHDLIGINSEVSRTKRIPLTEIRH